MFVEIPKESPEKLTQVVVKFPQGETIAWPTNLQINTQIDPRIAGAIFGDAPLLNFEFVPRLLSQAAQMQPSPRGIGGKKIRDQITWDSPAAKLLTLRALLLFCHTRGVKSAYVVDRWANVMDPGDYSTPHCHYDSEGAVVYFVDPGESNPAAPLDGNFEIIDSRIPACCPYQPERPIRGLAPKLFAGMMILFPAEFIHHVRPYSGQRPRITLAWNISSGAPPADWQVDMTKQVTPKIGKG